MKRNLLFFFVFGVALLFSSCNDDEGVTRTNTENYAVFVTGERTVTVPESGGTFELEARVTPRFVGPVRISFEVEGDPANFEVLSDENVITVPAGATSGKVLIKAIDNTDFNPVPNKMTIRLTGANAGYELPSGFGFDIGVEEKTIIFEDDENCAPGAEVNWVGSLNVEDVGFGNVAASGRVIDGNCGELIITGNLPNSNAQLTPDFLFVFDNSGDTGNVTCAPQPYGDNTYEATGTFNANTGQIEVYYLFKDAAGDLIWDGTNIITPN